MRWGPHLHTFDHIPDFRFQTQKDDIQKVLIRKNMNRSTIKTELLQVEFLDLTFVDLGFGVLHKTGNSDSGFSI